MWSLPLLSIPSLAVMASRLDATRTAFVDTVLRTLDAERRIVDHALEALRDGPSETAARDVEDATGIMLSALRAAPDHVLSSAIDALLRSNRDEWLDKDIVPMPVKRLLMRMLHTLNEGVGAYALWARELDALLSRSDNAHVYDLAAGTGGFARWLSAQPHGAHRFHLTSSDIEEAYLDIGREWAQREGVNASFERRDALSLRGLEDVDLFLCTQATHHLSAAQVVRMIAEAIRVAPRGIVIIDLYRSATAAFGTGAMLTLLAPPIAHDGFRSVQRSYSQAELTLFAHLAGAKHIETRLIGPVHVLLHASREN